MREARLAALALLAATACGSFGSAGEDTPAGSVGANDGRAPPGLPRDSGGSAPSDASSPDASVVDYIRTIFATGASYDGALGGVAGADAKCAVEAAKSTHAAVTGRSFRAWLSEPGDDAAARLAHGTLAYVIPVEDGETARIAESWSALRVKLERNIDRDQHGKLISSLYYVWTGATSAGAATTPHCSGWTSNAGEGSVGATFRTDAQWSLFGPKACNESARLFCIQE